ncbi:hypothetical protein JKF63_07547 [Porcisia hertigi]|uniref:Uncharacterized protein n=1 Tax=Porcisia hertigi TaxID=2761500 RepID=A0A836LGG1_9TRYP|nr:hypothetical protein JKF63_07547 [Porcisia hertigi]
MMTPCQGDFDSICSPSSSECSSHHVGQTNERLIDLLTRPRALGGYDGRLNYAGFVALAVSLGWNQEDMDDCWYDIVMGEPCAETVDMARVVECVCSYCLASPLPILERKTVLQSVAAHPASPRNPEPPFTDQNLTSPLSPPTPPSHVVRSIEDFMPEEVKRQHTRTGPSSSYQASPQRTRGVSSAYRRYAVGTVSSEHKKTCSSLCLQSNSAQRGRAVSNSPRRAPSASSTPRPSNDSGNTVFLRLYQKGMEQHRMRTCTTPTDNAIAECTFRPHVTPYPRKTLDAKSFQYNKPTESFFAKLTARERRQDAFSDAPETPRVTYHPAPGPSSTVPVGYVEGVARLRSYIASRYAHTGFEGSLRGNSSANLAHLVEAPILRLPVTVNGVTNSVDVRLASPGTRARRGQRL